MAAAGGAAGPAPDVRHQRPGKTVISTVTITPRTATLVVYNSILVCRALVIWMYYAIVQESVVLYGADSDRETPLKNGLARVVAFL